LQDGRRQGGPFDSRLGLSVAIAPGTYRLGPDNASLQVRTYREGIGAKVGHDLVLDVTHWEATVDIADDPARSSVELSADARSLEVREALRGVKPLTDRDRDEIRRNIDEKVLRGQPIRFRSSTVSPLDGEQLVVEGELDMAGSTRPVTAHLDVDAAGRVTATLPLAQSAWGIRPYRGLMGALKVRDEVEVVIAAQLPRR
jgi:polyisoprenoid-binding protein YceI